MHTYHSEPGRVARLSCIAVKEHRHYLERTWSERRRIHRKQRNRERQNRKGPRGRWRLVVITGRSRSRIGGTQRVHLAMFGEWGKKKN
jgi:hypothetical protein